MKPPAFDMDRQRRAYAKGFYDGIEKAAKGERTLGMNQAKFHQKHDGLSSIAKKVFDVIPINEVWNAKQINAELHRTTRSTVDVRILTGCLNTLHDAGLIVEPERGSFRRVEVKEKQDPPKLIAVVKERGIDTMRSQPDKSEQPTSPSPTETKKGPMDVLLEISTAVGSAIASLQVIKEKIEAAAVEIEGQIEGNKQDTEKLRQLQSILKSIGQ